MVMFTTVNFWAVLVAAVSTMILGFLWYSPVLFAKPWMVLMGYDPNDKAKAEAMRKSAGTAYIVSLIASIVSAFVLSRIIRLSAVHTAVHGMRLGAGVWLGFVTTVQLTDKLFANKPWKLYLINTGYQLICYLAMGAILAAWPR